MKTKSREEANTPAKWFYGCFILVLSFHHVSAVQQCEPGLLLPVWEPQEDLTTSDRFARGIVYFLAMLYAFIGVSIISDRFMASIEVITSKEHEIKIKKSNGETQIAVVRVWNETVANLTLMALGSSAPEILLSIIEIWAKKFEAGDLGPGTIVGSAAFNLLVIIAICVYVIPDGEVRRINHLRVFFVTATWSVFAYIWLLIIVRFSSPGVIDVWEGVVTFLFFPITVMSAYLADRHMLIHKFLSKQFRLNSRGVIVEVEGNLGDKDKEDRDQGLRVFEEEASNTDMKEFEDSRREFIRVLRDLRKNYPNMEPEQIEEMARQEILTTGPKSRAFYRMQATRKLMGGQNLMKKIQDKAAADASQYDITRATEAEEDPRMTHVCFDPGHYTVMENVGSFQTTVIRQGGDLSLNVSVDYKTEDGTALAGSDYIPASGTLSFAPGERQKTITVKIVDDEDFEEDEHFYIRLTNARFSEKINVSTLNVDAIPKVELTNPFLATVIILDDDHCGVFNLPDKNIETVESVGSYDVKVVRWSGARGKVILPYQTIDGTAKAGKDYIRKTGELIFENNETEKYVPIQILEADSYQKDVLFYFELKDPHLVEDKPGGTLDLALKNKQNLTKNEKIALEGWPKLGSNPKAHIRIKESKEFKNTVDKLVQRANASLLVGTSSWKEQFIEAVTVNAGDDDDDGDGNASEKVPSCGDYIMHFLTIFWKILFAFVPPTDILGGYVAFIVSIMAIGCLTAVIGDLASHLGCSVGLKDSVTAIVFVALGTSVPDTFASKVAAVQDEFADASVGNVTGSNGVNVFLGIGIAWTIAAVYHTFIKDLKGCNSTPKYKCGKFNVPPGNLAFSVTLFCSVAAVAISVMLLRRIKAVGGELGGPTRFKIPTSILFVSLWVFYIVMSSLEAYKILKVPF